MKTYVIRKCSNKSCKKVNQEIEYEKNTGYSNPFQHLRLCIAHGDVYRLHDFYNQKLADKRNVEESRLEPKVNPKEHKEVALYALLRMIVFENLPISVVEDREFCSLTKLEAEFSVNTVCNVIVKLQELVYENILKKSAEEEEYRSKLQDELRKTSDLPATLLATNPIVINSITLLRKNEKFWSFKAVQRTYRATKSE
ncbi:unnamed protein product [Agarophyton chilense]